MELTNVPLSTKKHPRSSPRVVAGLSVCVDPVCRVEYTNALYAPHAGTVYKPTGSLSLRGMLLLVTRAFQGTARRCRQLFHAIWRPSSLIVLLQCFAMRTREHVLPEKAWKSVQVGHLEPAAQPALPTLTVDRLDHSRLFSTCARGGVRHCDCRLLSEFVTRKMYGSRAA